MDEVEPRWRAILDASFLLTPDARRWLDDPEVRQSVVISSSLAERIADPEAGFSLRSFTAEIPTLDLPSTRLAIRGIDTFSWDGARFPSEESSNLVQDILAAREGDSPVDIFADEFAFIVSNSLGVFEGKELAIAAFNAWRRAGVRSFEISRQEMTQMLENVRDRLPRGLLQFTKDVSHFPRGDVGRFIVLGGGLAAGVLFPPLALPANAATLLQTGVAVIVGDP